MLADLLYNLIPYQIFKSVFFRGGLTYLTTYMLVNFVFPKVIRYFRRQGITSDFKKMEATPGPYKGATPIMGGLVLIPAIVISTLLWAWMNKYTIVLVSITILFSIVGAMDDIAKVFHKRKVESGKVEKKSYADKADGISGTFRLSYEFGVTAFLIIILYMFFDGVDNHIHIPTIPMKNWFPVIPDYLLIILAIFIIVGGANAVNLSDGLDSLASIPVITCSVFIASAAYIAGDPEWSEKLKIIYISAEIKEVSIFSIAVIAACVGFLKYNSPPASIYMGDVGSLGLGAAVCTMFVLVRTELYLPIVGWTFVLAAISTILQRVWFKIALWRKGRAWAEKYRFFYRAPYHHHHQHLITFREKDTGIRSVWHFFLIKMGIGHIEDEDKYLTQEQVNNKVIWSNHLRSISLLVISMMIYFKIR